MSNAQPLPPQQGSAALTPAASGEPAIGQQRSLLVREGQITCALSLASVVETMRPLRVQAMRGMPPYVQGVSVIRGQTVPVVRLGSLLCMDELPAPRRFVLLRVDRRHVALAVEAVPGVFRLEGSIAQAVPPLLQDAQPELIASIGALDRELLLVLQSSRMLPADVWAALAAHQSSLSA